MCSCVLFGVQERKQRVVDHIYRLFKLEEAKHPCDYGLLLFRSLCAVLLSLMHFIRFTILFLFCVFVFVCV